MTFKPKSKPSAEEISNGFKNVPVSVRPSTVTVSMGYKGIKVGGDEYHPEKVDILISKTLEHIPGETPDQTKARIANTDELQELLMDNVSKAVGAKIKVIKDHLKAQKIKANQDSSQA